ncbi:hypothetical protein SK854_14625 [Lentzea sp. BCCO 10_0061]|uniref:Sigma-54 factor interaction domain-containing protein n=1 Tax=Lentzea sokolovensis TaxID=3095429 RepID=A0ABU4UWH3_9PSEU|nr:hypothetical protein [Lentzea sp. BCCO 10_0061]MDX8143359.1 hypothetical protein [Lentzea sp. BCCO 10_0061]
MPSTSAKRHRRLDVLKGFSGRFIADLDHLERTRNYLWPGDVARALEAWIRYENSPARRFWLNESSADDCGCCPHPVEQRELLGFVARALPRKSARELRKRLEELDALY